MQRNQIETWNTGRLYTEQGQIIAATVVVGGIALADISRGIDYYLPGADAAVARVGLRAAAMAAYDGPAGDGGRESPWGTPAQEVIPALVAAAREYQS